MSITPKSPALIKQGQVQTWVTSRWKNLSIPDQFSVEINMQDTDYLKIVARFRPRLEDELAEIERLDDENASWSAPSN